jgi:hypothetical protein
MKDLLEEAFKLLKQFGRVTPPLLMRRFKITWNYASKLRDKVNLRQHNEARELAKRIEFK